MRRAAAALAVAATLCAAAAEAAEDPAAALPGEAGLAPMHRAGAVERHTAETLWERIDGEAELYRAYGLVSSAHASYEGPAAEDRRVVLSVFLFSDPLGAFGIYASFRPPECAGDGQLGSGGCLGDYQGFFWQGTLFVLVDGAGPETTRPADIRRALETAVTLAGPSPPPPEPLRAFSRLADARTIRYQPQHLLGRSALPPGLEGSAAGIPVFVSAGPVTPASAQSILDAYAPALEGAVRSVRDGRQALVGRDPALGPVALLGSGHAIAGARSGQADAGLWELLATLLGGGNAGAATP